ncbi:hypothetical protein Tco_0646387 [Tanacetum coccineum]
MFESNAYKTYYMFASREKAPKPKYVRKKAHPDTSPKQKHVQATKGTRLKSKAKVAKPDKKKQPAKKIKAKGLVVLSEVALTKAEQLKLATKKSKKDFHMSYASGVGDGFDTQSKVPDEQQQKSSGTDEGTGDSEDEDNENNSDNISDESDDDNDGNDGDDDDATDVDKQEGDDTNDDDEETNSNRTESDKIKIHILDQSTTEFYEEEEENIDDKETMYDDEDDEVTKELYEDVNVNLGNEDTEMTNADQGAIDQQNVFQQSEFEQVEEEAHVTLTLVLDTQKTDEPVQSSSVFSDFTSKLLNLENPSLADNEITSLMETSACHATTSAQALSCIPAIVDRYMDNKLGEAINKAILAHNLDCRQEAQDEKNAYIELVDTSTRALIKEEVNTQLPQIASLFEFELTKILIDKMEKNKSYDKADYKMKLYDALVESYNTDKDLFDSYGEIFSLKRRRDEDKDRDPSVGSDRGKKRRKSSKDVESSKDSSLPRQRSQVILLKTQASNKIKSSSRETIMNNPLTKRLPKPASSRNPRDLQLLILIGSPVQEKYVYSRRRIIAVARLKIMKMYDYGHLEEIEIRQDDQKLYTFKEGDFKRLRLQDIQDMLLLLIQQKLTNLTIDERYQKKLNLTKPDTYKSNLRNKTAYTSHSDLHGIIYMDQFKRKRLMRADELHKFSDGTLNDVRTALHDIVAGIRMEYLLMRKWSNLDKKRAWVMVPDTNKQLYQRRLMRNLEKFVGGREYRNDLRLLERTI